MPIESPPIIVHPYEPVPNPNQGRTEFNANMQATFNRWPETSASQEEMGKWMEQTANQTEIWAGDAEQAVTDATNAGSAQVALAEAQVALAEAQVTIAQGHASDAQNSAAMAAAAANNHGDWSLLSGAFPAGEAVIHDGAVWISLDAIADVATSEPGVSGDWFNYSDSVEGLSNPMTTAGDLIIGGTGGAPTRVAKGGNNTIFAVNNAGNLGYQTDFCGYGNAIALTNVDDINTVVPPNTTNGNAFYRWTAGSAPASLPSGFGAGYMLAMSQGGTQYRRQLLFQRDGARVVNRFTTNSGATWADTEVGTVTEAPTDGTRNIRRNGSWETIGAITGSGITMNADRIAGRLSSSGAVQELTGAQVRTLANAAQAGAFSGSGLTMATARVIGRTTTGTGAPEELTGAQLQAFLGIAQSAQSFADSGWVSSNSNSIFLKTGSVVVAFFRLQNSASSSTTDVVYSGHVPAGFRPASGTQQSSLTMLIGASSNVKYATVSVTTSGNVTFSRSEGYTEIKIGTVMMSWQV